MNLKNFSYLAIVLLFVGNVLADEKKHSYMPQSGYISDALTAVKVQQASHGK